MDKVTIFQKLAANTATEAERTLFREWLASLSVEERRKTMEEFESYMSEASNVEEVDEKMFEELIQKINGAKIINIRRLVYRYVSIAAVLIILAGIGFWLSGPAKVPDAPAIAKTVLTPGGNKAILTLANGEQIELNGKANGSIADQNGMQIIKLDSGMLSYKGRASQIGYNTLSVPRGGKYQVELPDGSEVWINSASTLRYPTAFTGKTREVELKGEAYFEVTKDPSKPFHVKVRDVSINVLGTGFNIMGYEDEGVVRTTLVHGSVSVAKGEQRKVIEPGQQASTVEGEQEFSISRPDIDQVLAWKNGQFLFNNTDIRSIMRQIARWYDVDVVYEGEINATGIGGGMPRAKVADSLLSVLTETGLVKFKIERRQITVLPGK